jgi:hypothetical protein
MNTIKAKIIPSQKKARIRAGANTGKVQCISNYESDLRGSALTSSNKDANERDEPANSFDKYDNKHDNGVL